MVEREMTILVIEDELLSRDLLANMLEGFGYRVLSAACGETGREIAGNETPDLILLDIIMPDEDGFETCRKLKAHSATSDIPVIFISGNNDIQSKVKGLSIGGWNYITKPFQPDEVNARARNCLKLRFAYQQIIREQAMRLEQMHDAQQEAIVKHASQPAWTTT